MKKATKKAATSTAAANVEVKKNSNSNKIRKVAKQKLPTHITEDDPEWDDYITGLKKNVDDAIDAGLFNWHLAYVGFIDDPDTGLADLYEGEKMFRILVSNGYCPECANNYINAFKDELNDKGQKTHYLIVPKEEQEFWCIQEEYEARQLQATVKHMKD